MLHIIIILLLLLLTFCLCSFTVFCAFSYHFTLFSFHFFCLCVRVFLLMLMCSIRILYLCTVHIFFTLLLHYNLECIAYIYTGRHHITFFIYITWHYIILHILCDICTVHILLIHTYVYAVSMLNRDVISI